MQRGVVTYMHLLDRKRAGIVEGKDQTMHLKDSRENSEVVDKEREAGTIY